MEVFPYLLQEDLEPRATDIARWAIMLLMAWRTWRGAQAAIAVSTLGFGLGAIIYLCIALVPTDKAPLLPAPVAIVYAVIYALMSLTFIYSRSLNAYLRRRDGNEGAASDGEMSIDKDSVVVYAAKNAQDANLLKNILAREGISAAVTNQMLEGGSGVDILGWPTLPRVVVRKSDAEHAREVAADFDRRAAAHADHALHDEAAASESDFSDWPRCPKCDAQRLTRCPCCRTSGTRFHKGDITAGDVLHPTAGPACHCGPAGCTSDEPETNEDAAAAEQTESETAADLLVCATCDEPFRPEYARICEWCGHDFGEGFEATSPEYHYEPVNVRIVVVMIGLVIFAVAVLIYFAMLAPPVK